jgi:hypothetical protein
MSPDLFCTVFYYTATEKWSTLRPTEEIEGLEAEMQESISCEECYPACSDTTYNVQTSSAELSQTPYVRSGFMYVRSVLLLTGEILRHFFTIRSLNYSLQSIAKDSDLLRYNAVSTGKRLPMFGKNILASIFRKIRFFIHFLINYFDNNCVFFISCFYFYGMVLNSTQKI